MYYHIMCQVHGSHSCPLLLLLDFTCCTNVSRPCYANLTSPYRTSNFKYDKELDTMVPQRCDYKKVYECCDVVPWPEGIMHGYPYRLRTSMDENIKLSYTSHM